MTTTLRFPQWADLSAEARRDLGETAAARARRLEPLLNAFIAIEDPARPVDGPLAGLPYAAKDIFQIVGRRPTAGLSEAIDLGIDGDAEALRRLDRGGGYRVGFTSLTELAYEPSGHNATRGRVRNPWNLDFIAGGSSSGSAAAVASGSVVIAVGSDTAGSLRIPAHACGVTAWKPTSGAVSTRGAMALAPTLDTIGLLARNAADLLPALRIIADEALPRHPDPILSAVVLSDLLDGAQESVRQACRDGIDAVENAGIALGRSNGEGMLGRVDPHVLTLLQAEAARTHAARLESHPVAPTLGKRLAKGLAINDAALAHVRSVRAALAAEFIDRILGRADIALLPVMAIRTPPAAECDPDAASFRPRTLYELSRLTRFVNMLGFPAVALPVGFDDRGMPVALQLVGRPNSDVALVGLAAAIQRKTDWHNHVPSALTELAAATRGAAT